jgi:2,4-dienoyl-CoA reductase-like NADH-dependent reductase (Old Yellow Enzyme family)
MASIQAKGSPMTRLFSPLKIKSVAFKNRIFVSPMCQYSCDNGMPNDWHLVHLGSRAVGGAALVIAEATAVSPEGRISAGDCGIWSAAHTEAFKPIAAFIEARGAVPGIQIAHAGRKASTDLPWRGGLPVPEGEGGWQPIAPSPVAFDQASTVPREMTAADMDRVVAEFAAAAARSLAAGFKVLELHLAHGYLLHEFLSPITNHRPDQWGGDLENRQALPLRVAAAVRKVWPENLPLFARISCTDWVENGWDLDQSIDLSGRLKALGVDFIDCSSGGTVPDARIPAGPGFQAVFSAAVRKAVGIATGAVGLITSPTQAEQLLVTEQADAVLLGREFLRSPYWPLTAAADLGVDLEWPDQYKRAKPV